MSRVTANSCAQEIAHGRDGGKTRKASVVVTNPTRFAVALYYDEAKTPLPIVLSKGQDLIAQARSCGREGKKAFR